MCMNFEIIDNADIGSRYHINRIIRNEIKIIEIGEFDYDYYDFVIIYFMFGKQTDDEIIELINQYRQKTICIIGCVKEISDDDILYPDDVFMNFFDLYFYPMMDLEVEDLIQVCFLNRGGEQHGDPQDWIFEKSAVSFYSETGKSLDEATDAIKKRHEYIRNIIKTSKYIGPEIKNSELKHNRAIIAFLSNGIENILQQTAKSIAVLSQYLTVDASLFYFYQEDNKSIEKGFCKIVFILGELIY